MTVTEEINTLRRLMESINRLGISNAQSLGKLATEQLQLRQELQATRQLAERALQLANDLVKTKTASTG